MIPMPELYYINMVTMRKLYHINFMTKLGFTEDNYYDCARVIMLLLWPY